MKILKWQIGAIILEMRNIRERYDESYFYSPAALAHSAQCISRGQRYAVSAAVECIEYWPRDGLCEHVGSPVGILRAHGLK